jgi:hypothetical protein
VPIDEILTYAIHLHNMFGSLYLYYSVSYSYYINYNIVFGISDHTIIIMCLSSLSSKLLLLYNGVYAFLTGKVPDCMVSQIHIT